MSGFTTVLVAVAGAMVVSLGAMAQLRQRDWWAHEVRISRLVAALLSFLVGTLISTGLYLGGTAVDNAANARDKLSDQQHELGLSVQRITRLENPTAAQIRNLIDRFLHDATKAQRRQAVRIVRDVIDRGNEQNAKGQRNELGLRPRGPIAPPDTGPPARRIPARPLLPPVRPILPSIPGIPPVPLPQLPQVDVGPVEPLPGVLPPIQVPELDLTAAVRQVLAVLGLDKTP